MTKKGIRTQFSNLGMQCPLKPESDLNYASLLQIRSVTNQGQENLIGREIFERSNCTMINAVEIDKRIF